MIFPLMEALHRRRIRILERPEFGHFLTAYALLHRRMARAFDAAIRAITEEERRRETEGYDLLTKGNPVFALDAFQDAVYKAAEIFEFYESHLVNCIVDIRKKNKQEYISKIKKAKRLWSMLYNKCKHNHAFLIPIEAIYDNGHWVSGFSLLKRNGDNLSLEREFHGNSEALSYNWSLRHMFADIMEADSVAAEVVSGLSDASEEKELSTLSITAPYINCLLQISERAHIAMPGEVIHKSSNFFFHDQNIVFGPKEEPMVVLGPARISCLFEIFGNNIKAKLPYTADFILVNGAPEPVGGLFRLAIRDIRFDPKMPT